MHRFTRLTVMSSIALIVLLLKLDMKYISIKCQEMRTVLAQTRLVKVGSNGLPAKST